MEADILRVILIVLPDFVKLAESYKAVGLRAKTTDELDDVIKQMIETKKL